jgi:hypothetical protein
MHSRQHGLGLAHAFVILRSSKFGPRLRGATTLLALLLAVTPSARAQRADSARVAVRPVPADTTRPKPKPPLSPRRAFLYSLLLPGYSQSVLGRPTAGAIFVLSEAIAISMLRESYADLNEARRMRSDSVIVIGVDPATGRPITQRTHFNDDLISVRKGHVEDWIAFLVGNHIFAAADGFVAAHLWDLPMEMSVRPDVNGTVVTGRLRW